MKPQLILFLSLAGCLGNVFGASQQLPKSRIGRHQHIYTEQELNTLNQAEIKKLHQECRKDISFRYFLAVTGVTACYFLCPQALALKALLSAKAACSLGAGVVAVKSTMHLQDKMVNHAMLASLYVGDGDLKTQNAQHHSTSQSNSEATRVEDDKEYKKEQSQGDHISVTIPAAATINTTEKQITDKELKKKKSEAAAFAAATGNTADDLQNLNTPQNQNPAQGAPQDPYRPQATTRVEALDSDSDSEVEEINALRILWLHSNRTE